MAIPLTLREFDELADPILNEVFFAGYERALSQGQSVLSIFGQRNPGMKRYAYSQSIGGVGRYDKREEGGPVNKDRMEQLFKTTFEMVEYNKVVPIDVTMIKDQNYVGINEIVDSLGVMAAKSRREDAASVFNNAFSSSYLGGDSKALCTTDHPLDKDGANSQGNDGSTALSYDAVTDTVALMGAFKDARNEPAIVIPDLLVVPWGLWETATQIVKNINEPDTGDRNVNALLQNRPMKLIIDPYLSDSNNWFLIDSVLAERQLLWWNREELSFGIDQPTQTDKNYYVGGTMRYDYGWSDWRFIYGHEVA